MFWVLCELRQSPEALLLSSRVPYTSLKVKVSDERKGARLWEAVEVVKEWH